MITIRAREDPRTLNVKQAIVALQESVVGANERLASVESGLARQAATAGPRGFRGPRGPTTILVTSSLAEQRRVYRKLSDALARGDVGHAVQVLESKGGRPYAQWRRALALA